MTNPVAIIGAGVAGLSCARVLAQSGIEAQVFDKGRKPGGRVATRNIDGVAFDDGAQYATARDPLFVTWMRDAAAAGHAAPWPAAAQDADTRWVGVPGMSALPGALAADLSAPVLNQRHAAFLHDRPEGWLVRHMPAESMRPGSVADHGGALDGPFASVLLAMPAPQAACLLATAGHPFAQAAGRARYAPCWAAVAAFAEPVAGPDTLRSQSGPLRWAAREASRPGRARSPDAWVLHGAGEWSRAALEREAADVAADLVAAFRAATGAPEPLLAAARRWRYALVETPLGEDCLWDAAAGIGACGDWCIAGRVEAAWLSGRALAARVLGRP